MLATLEQIDTAALHKAARLHSFEVVESNECGCFFCQRIFKTSQIVAWTDHGLTALCPYCHMDAVIPAYDQPVTPEMLAEMNRYAF